MVVGLPVLLVVVIWLLRRHRLPADATGYLLFVSLTMFLLLLAANEWVQAITAIRVRYLGAMWPPVLLLAGRALWSPSPGFLCHVFSLLIVALLALAGVSDFLRDGQLVRASWAWRFVPASVAATRMIADEGSDNGLLVNEQAVFRGWCTQEFYTGMYKDRRMQFKQATTSREILERAQVLDLVWLMLRQSRKGVLNLQGHVEHFTSAGWFHCRSWQDDHIMLELFLAPWPASTPAQPRLQFNHGIALYAPTDPVVRDDLLRLTIGIRSPDDTLLSRYSLALHILEAQSARRVAQGDIGVGPGAWVPLCREIDVSDLPAGNSELRVALYDWRTGERLPATDLETGASGDILPLHRFRLD